MTIRAIPGWMALIALSLAACSDRTEVSEDAPGGAACDRQCLIQLTDTYVKALVAGDPSAAPLAADVAFVENLARVKPGEGLWRTAASGPTGFAIHVPDVVQQQAGFLGVIEREGEKGNQPVLVAIRLKLESGRITEAEHLVAGISASNMPRLATPRAGLTSEVPAGSRQNHDDLVRIGLSYYDALDDNNGSLMPFADDCERHENGMVTAGPQAGPGPTADPKLPPMARTCAAQLDSQTFVYIDRIENRRLIAADPVTGLAMGFSHFRHPMDNLPYRVTHIDGSTSERNAGNMPFKPFDLPAAHIFKVGADGKVHEIEAMGFTAPSGSPTGWE